jgi:hypothetical protein
MPMAAKALAETFAERMTMMHSRLRFRLAKAALGAAIPFVLLLAVGLTGAQAQDAAKSRAGRAYPPQMQGCRVET